MRHFLWYNVIVEKFKIFRIECHLFSVATKPKVKAANKQPGEIILIIFAGCLFYLCLKILMEVISMMSNKLYDVLKWVALILLPASGTLYFALAGIWNFPYGEEIVGTITAVDTFFGVCLGISTMNYNKKEGDGE